MAYPGGVAPPLQGTHDGIACLRAGEGRRWRHAWDYNMIAKVADLAETTLVRVADESASMTGGTICMGAGQSMMASSLRSAIGPSHIDTKRQHAKMQ
jgi:hypothetical protein